MSTSWSSRSKPCASSSPGATRTTATSATPRWQAQRRYELTDTFALRGTASTGFRAPTLAEEFYSATNVGPTTAFVQMPPNAPATALAGLGAGLQPRSRPTTRWASCCVLNGDVAVIRSVPGRSAQPHRGTSTFYGTIDGVLVSQPIVDAIIANGNVLDPEVTASGDTASTCSPMA
jgi:iron complex outermembrane receptor protein